LTQRATSDVDELLAARSEANARFFEREAGRLARLCRLLSERFLAGGRLVALGRSPVARSDARHVAVEFVHPVIVGKRALPAIAVTAESGPAELIVAPGDIVMAFDGRADAPDCLTIAFAADAGAEWTFVPPTDDPFVAQELVETLYHVLWELVHVFFEHTTRSSPVSGASSFLYPFLAERADDLDAVVEDVRRSVLMKAGEVGALREQTLGENRDALHAAAADLRRALDAGGTLFALGNGGSATDAMDAVADFRAAGRRALDLTEDAGIITAVANDIGTEAIFARQLIALARAGDALLALSTSGNSPNVIAALAEARRRGLTTVALVGYDGGRVAAESLADHVVVTRSEHIPRIQEAQASAYHVLAELVEADGA
jgi:D-sedoheptulose 7-phosphate isomerase